MKKSLLTCSLILALISVNTANAENLKTSSSQSHVDLNEIILDNGQKQNYELPNNNLLMATENPINQTNSSETTLENKNITPEKKEKSFLKIFNLQGGVEKTTASEETGENTQETEVEKTALRQWIDGDYATGKWFGTRPVLEDHGLKLNSSLLYGTWGKTRGGMNDAASGKSYALYNLGVTFDTEKAGLWKGGTFFALYQSKRGYGLSGGAMGDMMVLDGWDWREMNQVSEYWYQQKFFDNKLRLKVGKQDSNTDFAYLNCGWDFLNTSFSIMPNIPMPTYPSQSFGFMAEINPKEWLSIKDGIYSMNNIPFNISEIELKPMIKGLPGRYNIGAWESSDTNGMSVANGINYNTGEVSVNRFNRNFGAYVQFEQMVYKEKKNDEKDMQGLIAFGQFAICPSNKNDVSRYVGGGLEYTGLIPKRDKDKAGIAVASGAFAGRLGDITSQVGSETSLEAFYRIQLTPWFFMQPDIQFITNPGGAYTNSVAIGMRTAITF